MSGGTTVWRPAVFIDCGFLHYFVAYCSLQRGDNYMKKDTSDCLSGCSVDTLLAQAGNRSDDNKTGSISTPLYFSTAFRHPGLGDSTGFDYARVTTPTRQILETELAKLENGSRAFATSSGMSAIDLVFSTLLNYGDHFITSDDLYGGTFRYFDATKKQSNVSFDIWDGKSLETLRALITDRTKLIWIETPSNPMMKVIDIKSLVQAIKKDFPEVLVAVDNTFLTPIFQKPLLFGADIVVHSATKYLAGHNDLLAGVVITNSTDIAGIIETQLITRGQVLDSFSSWLLIRSLKTLHLRMARHNESGQYLASKLKEIAGINQVLYSGLGGMVSFYVAEDVDVNLFLRGLKIVSFAESLGGPETLVTIPTVQTHCDMPEEQRLALGITDRLIRLSVGLEDPNDLLKDLTEAIEGAKHG